MNELVSLFFVKLQPFHNAVSHRLYPDHVKISQNLESHLLYVVFYQFWLSSLRWQRIRIPMPYLGNTCVESFCGPTWRTKQCRCAEAPSCSSIKTVNLIHKSDFSDQNQEIKAFYLHRISEYEVRRQTGFLSEFHSYKW